SKVTLSARCLSRPMHFPMESIHLKLPSGLVSISSDAQQPSGHPYLHARARAPFRIEPEAAGEVGLPRGCGRHAVRESTPAWSGIGGLATVNSALLGS